MRTSDEGVQIITSLESSKFVKEENSGWEAKPEEGWEEGEEMNGQWRQKGLGRGGDGTGFHSWAETRRRAPRGLGSALADEAALQGCPFVLLVIRGWCVWCISSFPLCPLSSIYEILQGNVYFLIFKYHSIIGDFPQGLTKMQITQ